MVIENEGFCFFLLTCCVSLPFTSFFLFCSFKIKSMQYKPEKSAAYILFVSLVLAYIIRSYQN